MIILAGVEAIYFFVIGNNSRAFGSLLCYDNGPGSYYVWCYMQIWSLIPAIYILFKRFGLVYGGSFIFIVSLLLDFLWEKYIGIKPGLRALGIFFKCSCFYASKEHRNEKNNTSRIGVDFISCFDAV